MVWRARSRTLHDDVRPVVCLITPPASGDVSGDACDDALVQRAGVAARAGVQLIQLRQPLREAHSLHLLVTRVLQSVVGTSARVLVNERLDVALAAGAHGVHLRSDSMSASRVRAIAPPGFLIGRSVHSPDESERVVREGGLDYLLFGTVFATPSKPGRAGVGTGALAAACARVSIPVMAVGGVEPQHLAAVRRAGAAGWAAIRFFSDPAPEALPEAVSEACAAFDSLGDLP